MYLEKAKLEEFEAYYQIKCERFVTFWSWGNYEIPPRENLYHFYLSCLAPVDGEKHKDIYFIKSDEGEAAGYLYLDYAGNRVDIPIALCERFTKKGFARQAILKGLQIAKRKGVCQSEVEIREYNTDSIRLYTSCGYQKGEQTREMYSSALGRTVNLYAYRRQIADVG